MNEQLLLGAKKSPFQSRQQFWKFRLSLEKVGFFFFLHCTQNVILTTLLLPTGCPNKALIVSIRIS